jgi:hypothetical protein
MKAAILSQRKSRSNSAIEGVVEFSFTKDEVKKLYWEDEEEFRYKGAMYDVIKKEQAGDEVRMLCIADVREYQLLEKYKNSMHQKGGLDPFSNVVLKLASVQFLVPAHVDVEINMPAKIEFPAKLISSLPSIFSSTQKPPPKVC